MTVFTASGVVPGSELARIPSYMYYLHIVLLHPQAVVQQHFQNLRKHLDSVRLAMFSSILFLSLFRQLYNSSADAVGSFDPGTGVAFMTNFNCRGNETSLLQCSYDKREITDCQSDATVVCKGESEIQQQSKKLTGSCWDILLM